MTERFEGVKIVSTKATVVRLCSFCIPVSHDAKLCQRRNAKIRTSPANFVPDRRINFGFFPSLVGLNSNLIAVLTNQRTKKKMHLKLNFKLFNKLS